MLPVGISKTTKRYTNRRFQYTKDMNSFALALSAIGSHLAMRLYIPAVIAAGAVVMACVAIGFWLTTTSEWWWLLFIPITILTCVILGMAMVVLALIRYVRPSQTKTQATAVKQFVDKLQGIADIAGTPKFIILFRVIRSVAAPKRDSYLADLASNKKLINDFRELQRLFDSRS
jgi:hypothetical protein